MEKSQNVGTKSAFTPKFIGTGSPPVKKPPIISHFYTDEEHVANKMSEGPNQTNSNPSAASLPNSPHIHHHPWPWTARSHKKGPVDTTKV